MSLLPPHSRLQLHWKVFAQEGARDWKLVLPLYYADLFEAKFSALLAKAGSGPRPSSTGKTRFVLFRDLDDAEVRQIQAFLDFYGRTVCIGRNKHLEKRFSTELDFCVALDFNKPAPGSLYTQIGEWEFEAKYRQSADATKADAAKARLVEELVRAIRWLPLRLIPEPRLLTYVPSDPGKSYYLPHALAQEVIGRLPATLWGALGGLLMPKLLTAKQSAKKMTVGQKIAQWERIFKAGAIQLSRSVHDCSVIVVDDLYQSGASLWSFAKYLKSQGARQVVGVACVKSLRDSDNQ